MLCYIIHRACATQVTVSPFELEIYEVSNAQFGRFVQETEFVTEVRHSHLRVTKGVPPPPTLHRSGGTQPMLPALLVPCVLLPTPAANLRRRSSATPSSSRTR